MNRLTLFLAGILFQLVAVFGLFLPNAQLVTDGTEIRLQTVPIDPRSLLRGDYVTLGYQIGQNISYAIETGTPVYVVLEQDGDLYDRVSYAETKPVLEEGQQCIRGRVQYGAITFPDIAQYFVEEDTGRDFESARNMHRLFVDVAVSKDCRAIIKGIVLGPDVPEDELWQEPPPMEWMPRTETTQPVSREEPL